MWKYEETCNFGLDSWLNVWYTFSDIQIDRLKMVEVQTVEMKRDSSLIDPNFNGLVYATF